MMTVPMFLHLRLEILWQGQQCFSPRAPAPAASPSPPASSALPQPWASDSVKYLSTAVSVNLQHKSKVLDQAGGCHFSWPEKKRGRQKCKPTATAAAVCGSCVLQKPQSIFHWPQVVTRAHFSVVAEPRLPHLSLELPTEIGAPLKVTD